MGATHRGQADENRTLLLRRTPALLGPRNKFGNGVSWLGKMVPELSKIDDAREI